MRKRLIAAYVLGASLPETLASTILPICASARQTGCLVDWNTAAAATPLALGRRKMITWASGKYELVEKEKWLCVNPLSWDRSTISPASDNRGSLKLAEHDEPLASLVPQLTGARCERGRLVVFIPLLMRKGFRDQLTIFGSYHNQDYSLFYASIRQNAIDRVKAFLEEQRRAR